jgi:hypothetical protein
MMNTGRHTCRGQEGAVFIQVGIAVFVLMAFNVFVLDYGLMWVARNQAQNAADAGALAGALARGYDDFADPPSTRHSLAAQIARGVAAANSVWQEAATPVVSFDCPAGVTGRCTKIDVFRDGTAGSNALPTLFGPMLGVGTQRVRATATAITLNGNATPCLHPIAFADDWTENRDPENEFNRYYEGTAPPPPGTLLSGDRDDYAPPTSTYAGATTVSVDFGERIIWELLSPLTYPITRRLLVPLDLPGGGTFADNMTGCVGQTLALNDTVPINTTIVHRDITAAINSVIAQDSGADYDYGAHRITNSCAPSCASVSPRLIPIALYDPRKLQLGRSSGNWTDPDVGCPTNNPCITITNIIGFFLHGVAGGYGPHGHFMRYPGSTLTTAPTYMDDGSWLVTTHLIR